MRLEALEAHGLDNVNGEGKPRSSRCSSPSTASMSSSVLRLQPLEPRDFDRLSDEGKTQASGHLPRFTASRPTSAVRLHPLAVSDLDHFIEESKALMSRGTLPCTEFPESAIRLQPIEACDVEGISSESKALARMDSSTIQFHQQRSLPEDDLAPVLVSRKVHRHRTFPQEGKALPSSEGKLALRRSLTFQEEDKVPSGTNSKSQPFRRQRTWSEEDKALLGTGTDFASFKVPVRRQRTDDGKGFARSDSTSSLLRRRSSVEEAKAPAGSDATKMPLRRQRTFPDERSQSQPCIDRRNSLPVTKHSGSRKIVQDMQALQVEAFEALMEHMVVACPLQEVAKSMLVHVMNFDCSPAFTDEQISSAVARVTGCQSDTRLAQDVDSQHADLETPRVGHTQLVDMLRNLAESIGMELSDVLGQILWQHRTAKVLRAARFRAVVEDLSWVEPGAGTLDADASVCKLVGEVFRVLAAPTGGGMRAAAWLKVIRMVELNPVLQPRLRRSDAHRLFYAHTHMNGESQASISCVGFKRLLIELADAMRAHPAILFLAVGSHAEHLAPPAG